MFICLVGQTPIVALADGDDTRVISVPEGLQEVLNYETPEVQTVEDENTIVDIPETQVAEGEDATVENPDTQMIQEDNTVAENPETQAEQTEEAAEEVPAVQNETTVNETPADQIIQ